MIKVILLYMLSAVLAVTTLILLIGGPKNGH
jgi:hypothetical protein